MALSFDDLLKKRREEATASTASTEASSYDGASSSVSGKLSFDDLLTKSREARQTKEDEIRINRAEDDEVRFNNWVSNTPNKMQGIADSLGVRDYSRYRTRMNDNQSAFDDLDTETLFAYNYIKDKYGKDSRAMSQYEDIANNIKTLKDSAQAQQDYASGIDEEQFNADTESINLQANVDKYRTDNNGKSLIQITKDNIDSLLSDDDAFRNYLMSNIENATDSELDMYLQELEMYGYDLRDSGADQKSLEKLAFFQDKISEYANTEHKLKDASTQLALSNYYDYDNAKSGVSLGYDVSELMSKAIEGLSSKEQDLFLRYYKNEELTPDEWNEVLTNDKYQKAKSVLDNPDNALDDNYRKFLGESKFNQLRNEMGEEEADRLYEWYKNYRKQEINKESEKAMEDFSSQNAFTNIIGNAASVGYSALFGTFDSAANLIAGANQALHDATDGEKVYYASPFDTNGIRNAVTSATNTMINDAMGDNEVGAYLANGAYGLTMSAGDMAASYAISKGLGTTASTANKIMSVIMGSEAGNAYFDQTYEATGNLTDAAKTGLIAGIAEGFFEKYSLDKIRALQPTGKIGWKNRVKDLIKVAGIEGSEEVATEVADILADTFINTDLSQMGKIYNDYLKEGKSSSEAFWLTARDTGWQIGEAGVSGAALGGIMGGGQIAKRAISQRQQSKSEGNAIKANENIESLTKIADSMPTDSLAYKLSQKVKGMESPSDKTVGDLRQAIIEERSDTYKSKVKEATKGLSEVERSVVNKALSGEMLTPEENKVLNSRPAVRKAIGDLSTEQSSTNEDLLKADVSSVVKLNNTDESERVAGFKVSESESNGITVDGNAVTNIKVKSVDKDTGLITYDVDGQEITNEQIEYPSQEIADLHRLATTFAADVYTANTMIDNYKAGQSVKGYLSDFALHNDYGRMGLDRTDERLQNIAYLDESQRDIAYASGIKSRANAQQVINALYAEVKKSSYYKAAQKGKVVLDGIQYNNLNESQKAHIDVMSKLSELFSPTIVFYESKTSENGKYIGENGSYDPITNTMRIDINAGLSTDTDSFKKNQIFNTISHELTHMAELAPEEYEAYKKLVVDALGESYEGLVAEEIERLLASHPDKNSDAVKLRNLAETEVIAQASVRMFESESFMDALIKDQPSVARKIIDAFNKLIKKIKDFINDLRTTNTKEAMLLENAVDDLTKLRDKWEAAVIAGSRSALAMQMDENHLLVEAIQGGVTTSVDENNHIKYNYDTLREPLDKQIPRVSAAGQSVTFKILTEKQGKYNVAKKMTGREITEHLFTTGYVQYLIKKEGMSKKDAQAYAESRRKDVLSTLDQVADFFSDQGLRYEEVDLQKINSAKLIYDKASKSYILSAMVKNGEYPVNFDLTMICRKREMMSYVIDLLGNTKGINGEESMLDEIDLNNDNLRKINKIMSDMGFETACLGCFVETRRYAMKKFITSFVDQWNAGIDELYKTNKALKGKRARYFGFAKTDPYSEELTNKDASAIANANKKYKSDAKAENSRRKSNTDENGKQIEKGLTAMERILFYQQSLAKDLGKNISLLKKLRFADIASTEGRTNFHKSHGGMLDSLFSQVQGTAKYKSTEVFTPYNSEIALMEKSKSVKGQSPYKQLDLTDFLKKIGGVRSNSFSDFIITHGLDYMQRIADMEGKGVTGHAYTKEIARAKIFGLTGEKINLSVMFEVDMTKGEDGFALLPEFVGLSGNSLDSDYMVGDKTRRAKVYAETGKYTFVQSIDLAEAIALQNLKGYGKNCGIIGVGLSYNNILKMLNDVEFRMIIPYHSSGMPIDVKLEYGYNRVTDYTKVQNTCKINSYKVITKGRSQYAPSYSSVSTVTNGQMKKTSTGVPEEATKLHENYNLAVYSQVVIDEWLSYNANRGNKAKRTIDSFVADKVTSKNASRYYSDNVIALYESEHSSNPNFTYEDAKGIIAQQTLSSMMQYWDENDIYVDAGKGKEETDVVDSNGEEKVKSSGFKGVGGFDLYGDLERTLNPRQTASNYIAYALDNECLPMFFEFADNENYYKFVYDFNVYDRTVGDGYTECALQERVQAIYPDNLIGIFEEEFSTYNDQLAYQKSMIPQLMQRVYNETKVSNTKMMSDAMREGMTIHKSNRANADSATFDNVDSDELTPVYSVSDVSKIKLQQREDGGYSNRELLANALDSVSANPQDKKTIAVYREGIKSLDEMEARLREVNAQIKDIAFTKGKDRSQLGKLTSEKQSLERKIVSKDKALLKLETTGAIARILDVEKKKAVAKAKAKAKADIASVRDRYQTKIDEANKRGRERVKTLREAHKTNEYIGKIKTLANKFKQMALKPTDTSFVTPDYLNSGFLDATQAIIDAINTNSATKAGQALANISSKIGKIMRDDSHPMLQSEFDDEFRSLVDKLVEELEEKKITRQRTGADNGLTLQDAEVIYGVMREIYERIRDANKLLGEVDRIAVSEAAHTAMSEIEDVNLSFFNKHLQKVKSLFLTPERFISIYTGFKDNAILKKMFRALESGVAKKNRWYMESRKPFDTLIKDHYKEYEESCTKPVEITYTQSNGEEATVKLTRMQAAEIVMQWKREQANDLLVHIERGGFKLYDPDDISKGKLKDAETKAKEIFGVSPSFITACNKILTDFDRQYIALAEEFFNRKSKDAINSVSRILKHRDIATERYYIPISVDGDSIKREINGVKYDFSLMSSGMLKSLMTRSSKLIDIIGLNEVVEQHRKQVANIYGLAIPIRDMNKTITYSESSKDEDGHVLSTRSVSKSLKQTFGNDHAYKMMESMLIDLQRSRGISENQTINNFLRTVRSNFVTATLNGNLSVVLKQAASYSTAGAYLSHKALAKAVGQMKSYIGTGKYQKLLDEIDSHTAEHYMRRIGMSSQEIDDINRSWLAKKTKNMPTAVKPNEWIQGVDTMTTATHWVACKEEVKAKYESQGKDINSEEYFDEVTKLYEKVLSDTQPVYDPLHRPEILKTSNELLKSVFMFKTQPLQNSNIIFNALGEYTQTKSKEAKTKLRKAIVSQIESLATFASMSLIVALLLHKMNRYRDEDDEITTGSIASTVLGDMLSNGVGIMLPFGGSEALTFINNKLKGKNYDLFSDNVVGILNDLSSAYGDFGDFVYNSFQDGFDIDEFKEAVNDVLVQTLGITLGFPLKNYENIVGGIIGHAEDIANGEFWSFNSGFDMSKDSYISKYDKLYKDGKTDEAKEYLSELYQHYIDEGKNPNDAFNSVRNKLANTYKKEYQKAFLNNDRERMQYISRMLNASGYMKYSNKLLSSVLNEWAKKAKDDLTK